MSIDQVQQFIKAFQKDLMQTRIQLDNLKQKIDSTLKQIQQKQFYFRNIDKKVQQKEKTPLLPKIINCESFSEQICFLKFDYIPQCEKCSFKFKNREQIVNHYQKIHSKCQWCQKQVKQSSMVHQTYLCPETKHPCPGCSLEIKRKQLNVHIKICCFRKCDKCKEFIYFKAHSYHLNNCEARKSLKENGRKKLIAKQNHPKKQKVISMFPCSIAN